MKELTDGIRMIPGGDGFAMDAIEEQESEMNAEDVFWYEPSCRTENVVG